MCKAFLISAAVSERAPSHVVVSAVAMLNGDRARLPFLSPSARNRSTAKSLQPLANAPRSRDTCSGTPASASSAPFTGDADASMGDGVGLAVRVTAASIAWAAGLSEGVLGLHPAARRTRSAVP